MLGLGSSLSLGGVTNDSVLDTIAGLQVWLQNGVGVAVEQWNDSSGNGNHITQSDSAKQAALDQGGLEFDTDNSEQDVYDFTADVAVTVFTAFVCIELDDADPQELFSNSGTADFLKINHNATTEFRIKKNDGAVDQLFNHSTDVPAGTYVLMFRQNAGNTMTYGVDLDFETATLSSSTATTMTINQFGLAGAGGIDGTVLEVAVYNSTLTDDEATLVINDISARCGL